MSDLLDRIKLSKYPASVWLGKANGQEIINFIEQLQHRVVELETVLNSLGYCTQCNTVPEHHVDEPFSSCFCGTAEDYATRPLQQLAIISQRNKDQGHER